MKRKLSSDNGAALVTVLIATVLLGTACIAMLSAVGASARNNTDALSEAKAFYAAESGLQATINAVRNDTSVSYAYAASNPTLSAKLPYNWPIGAPDRVVLGEDAATYTENAGTAYKISITDPDDASTDTTFYTTVAFSPTSSGVVSADGLTLYIPNQTATSRTEITITPNSTPTTVIFSESPNNPLFANFRVTNFVGGYALPAGTKIGFELIYRMTQPRTESTLVRGWFENAPTSSGPPMNLRFISQNYTIVRSTLELCATATRPGTSPGCSTVQPTLFTGVDYPVYAYLGPVPPYRLLVKSTGFGPNGARKTLEAIIQRDPFGGAASGAATTMIGPPCTPGPKPLDYCLDLGQGNVGYSGGNAETGVPAFGFTSTANLTLANTYIENKMTPSQVQPPPAMLGDDIPVWQQSVDELDRLIDILRTAAQNSNTYITNGTLPSTIGNPTAGTGITFCEGSCTAGGNTNGGGILVVTGKMKNNGAFNFKGLIIVTGEEGWDRSGAGGGQVIGNIVIAPYNSRPYVPENLSSAFLPPRYMCSGCGNSNVVYSDVSASFDSISGISDLMAGVAEK